MLNVRLLIKTVAAIVIGIVVTGCTSLSESRPVANVCKEPRPEMCTAIYLPVCGVDKKGELKTYASGCNACSNPQVVGFDEDSCEDRAGTKTHKLINE